MSTADTIYNQFGRRAFYMIGARNLIATDTALRFNFMKSRGTRATMCKIELDAGRDLYNMTFFQRVPGRRENVGNFTICLEPPTWKEIETHPGLFFDQLHEVFERATGLYTSI